LKICYLDNAATTRVHPQAVSRMAASFETDYFNPSAMYRPGLAAQKTVAQARQTIAEAVGAKRSEIIFTSGGSEGDSLLIRGIVDNVRPAVLKQAKIITSAVEHPAVRDVFRDYEQRGIEVVWLPVNAEGLVDLAALEKAVDARTILVSVIGVHNELGVIQPLAKMARIIKGKNPDCFFHSDFVQGFMKVPVDVRQTAVDGLTLCAHKVNGPKGVGAVYLREGWRIRPMILGGGQENGLRSGTENVQGIVGFEAAVKAWQDPDVMARIGAYQQYVAKTLTDALDDVTILGPAVTADRCPAVMSAAIKGIRGEVLLHAAEAKGVYIATGSACSTHKKEKHGMQKAIGLDRDAAEGTVRISFSALTTWEEVKTGTAVIVAEAQKLRKLMRRQ
jgi:cysteine desulfurase